MPLARSLLLQDPACDNERVPAISGTCGMWSFILLVTGLPFLGTGH